MYFLAFLLVASAVALANGTIAELLIYYGQFLVKIGIMEPFAVSDPLRNNVVTLVYTIEILGFIVYCIWTFCHKKKV